MKFIADLHVRFKQQLGFEFSGNENGRFSKAPFTAGGISESMSGIISGKVAAWRRKGEEKCTVQRRIEGFK
jgi:hypothetical protein